MKSFIFNFICLLLLVIVSGSSVNGAISVSSLSSSTSNSPNEIYVTSIAPCSINGGIVSIFGSFGYEYQEIVCYLGAGSGVQNVTITLSGYEWFGINYFHYLNPTLVCPNDCSGNGYCNITKGICLCYSGWASYDCSVPISTATPTDTPTNTPSISPVVTPIITCEYTGNGLNIKSNNPISCIGNGTTICYNVIQDSECSTTSPYGNIKCTSNYRFSNNSMICIGTHIECTSSFLSCKVNVIDNNFHVNDILQTENIAVVTSDNYNYFTNTKNIITSSSPSSSIPFYSSLILAITLLISIIYVL